MAHQEKEVQRDADGLVVQKYQSVVLVVLPPRGFGEQILRYARSALYNVRVGTWSVSSVTDEFVKGRLQDEFLVDGSLADARMTDYTGIILAGGEEGSPLATDSRVLDLVREAAREEKLVAAWGNAVEVLASAGVLAGHKVTGAAELREKLEKAGARYTGREYEVSRHVVTARDESAGMRFGRALAEIVRI
jgi:putative intracellular protease/amidase